MDNKREEVFELAVLLSRQLAVVAAQNFPFPRELWFHSWEDTCDVEVMTMLGMMVSYVPDVRPGEVEVRNQNGPIATLKVPGV